MRERTITINKGSRHKIRRVWVEGVASGASRTRSVIVRCMGDSE